MYKQVKTWPTAVLESLDLYRVAKLAARLRNGKPPGLEIVQSYPNFKMAKLEIDGINWLISLREINRGIWEVGFSDEKTRATHGLTGLAGNKVFSVFTEIIQAVLYLMDKLKVNCWTFGGEKERVRVYNWLIERVAKTNPELREKWELVEHRVGAYPGAPVSGDVGSWLICRKELAKISAMKFEYEENKAVYNEAESRNWQPGVYLLRGQIAKKLDQWDGESCILPKDDAGGPPFVANLPMANKQYLLIWEKPEEIPDNMWKELQEIHGGYMPGKRVGVNPTIDWEGVGYEYD